MKGLIKLEEILMFTLGVYLFYTLKLSWWWFFGFLLVPDIGMLGYLINAKTGAILYNLCHHKGLAIGIYLLGVFMSNNWIQFAGIILFSHSCLDRAFGYGLKYSDTFNNTHLGKIGKS